MLELLLVRLEQFLALGLVSGACIFEDLFDRGRDVDIVDAGQLLQRVPVVEAVAAGEYERA